MFKLQICKKFVLSESKIVAFSLAFHCSKHGLVENALLVFANAHTTFISLLYTLSCFPFSNEAEPSL